MKTRVAALFSGGKDSTYTAWIASKKDDLRCLVTVFPKAADSYMFHFPNLKWTSLQAKASGVPQLTVHSEGVKEIELADLLSVLSTAKEEHSIQGVYTGALASVYQKTRVEKVCAELSLECVSPFWGIDPETHLRNLVRDKFTVMVVAVSALGLDASWLGRILDGPTIDELVALGSKYRFHIGLEGGEGETFVLDCPLFKERVEVVSSSRHWRGDAGTLEVEDARLVPKA